MTTAALVPAAGRGQRFGSAENKIWAPLFGRTVLWWSVNALNSHPAIDSVYVIARADERTRAEDETRGFAKLAGIVPGGRTRAESVLNGMAVSGSPDLILVHDAARPLVSGGLISQVLAEAENSGAAIPGVPLTDTIKRADSAGRVRQTISRDGLWAVQTPQAVRRALLGDAYLELGNAALEMTDEAGILHAAGRPVTIVAGDPDNLKITKPDDLERAERLLRFRHTSPLGVRTGLGYDVHAFEGGRELWLGGVRIPHPCGLAGHSDADVLLHAVCDALLGAAGLGDIGVLFPDSNPVHKNRPSIEFLREVAVKIETAGWRVANLDVTLLAEEPRIGPYREQMRAVIADGLRTAPTQVNIKATTSEGLGFAGRREGIACWAVATLVS